MNLNYYMNMLVLFSFNLLEWKLWEGPLPIDNLDPDNTILNRVARKQKQL